MYAAIVYALPSPYRRCSGRAVAAPVRLERSEVEGGAWPDTSVLT